MESDNKKVFISYAWDSEEHKKWVLKLATNLRSHGVDTILDQWDARLGNDLSFFMEQGLTNSHLVLCICSDKYVEKANGGIGGAGYEKRIIASEMMTNDNMRFFIPVIKGNSWPEKVPTFLLGLKYVDFDDRDYYDCYQELLERIYDEDIKKKPPLGYNPFASTVISDQITTKLHLEKIEFQTPFLEGKVSFDYKKNSGSYIIGEGDYEFVTHWSECGFNSIYCYKDYVFRIGYNPTYKEFPSPKDFVNFNFSSRAKSVIVGHIIILENPKHKFAALKITKVVRKEEDIDHLLEFEYKIYKDVDGRQ
ncbi:MAG: toll/interleukin-1 receptor domain-containing protein [Bacteroidaceae bacterium]|nr:toll/interleukin-1 receptor domain-containing protein [Bacteroidaceae bacterium]